MKTVVKSLLKKAGIFEPVRDSWLWIRRPSWWRRERTQRRFFDRLVPTGSLAFDVGANVGMYTSLLLAAGAARVVAIEPQTRCLSTLHRKFNGPTSGVVIVPAAVGAAEGTITLYASDASDASQIATCSTEWRDAVTASGRIDGHQWPEKAKVPMTTLDRLIAEHGRPAFCKIDVEGFELDVLRGLKSPIEVLSFEFSPETIDRTCQCVEYLSSIGDYRFDYCAHGYYAFGLDEHVGPRAFQRALYELPPQAMKWGGDVYAWAQRAGD